MKPFSLKILYLYQIFKNYYLELIANNAVPKEVVLLHEITEDILYTMDINCFEKSFRDVDVSIDEIYSNFNDLADWQDPNGDKLILGVIGQVCRIEN